MIPCSCAASSASAICFAMGNASSRGIARGNALAQRGTLDHFEDEGGDSVRFFEAVDSADVGMIQRRERSRFPLKPCQAIRVAGKGVGEDLQRDVAPELRVPGATHLAHSADPDLGGDFKRAQVGTGEAMPQEFEWIIRVRGTADQITLLTQQRRTEGWRGPSVPFEADGRSIDPNLRTESALAVPA